MNGPSSQFKKFKILYCRQLPALKYAQRLLNQKLRKAMKPLLEKKLFRIRLLEQRIKDVDSLYRKILDDGIDIDDALKTGKIRDVLGARIVCHNLQVSIGVEH